jgi:hypothetical protein
MATKLADILFSGFVLERIFSLTVLIQICEATSGYRSINLGGCLDVYGDREGNLTQKYERLMKANKSLNPL